MRKNVTLADVRGRAVISVEEAGALLSLGRSGAYAAARSGALPLLTINGRHRVPVPALLKMLGADSGRPEAAEKPAND